MLVHKFTHTRNEDGCSWTVYANGGHIGEIVRVSHESPEGRQYHFRGFPSWHPEAQDTGEFKSLQSCRASLCTAWKEAHYPKKRRRRPVPVGNPWVERVNTYLWIYRDQNNLKVGEIHRVTEGYRAYQGYPGLYDLGVSSRYSGARSLLLSRWKLQQAHGEDAPEKLEERLRESLKNVGDAVGALTRLFRQFLAVKR